MRFSANQNGDPTLRAGLIGLGYWGPNVLRALSDTPGVRVDWLCDLDAGRVERLSRRYPASSTTTEVERVLENPELDAILIATPISTHHDLAKRALEAGKHVLVEKPLASSSGEAEDLLKLAEERERVLMCGHTFLYSPPVRTVKSILERDELGKVYFIASSRVNLGLHQRDVSVIWDLGPHDFSILLHWLGEMPETVTAVGRDSVVKGVPDVAFITLRYPSGLLINLEISWLAPSKLRRTVLVGSEKMIVYEDGAPEPVRIFDHGVVYRDPETFGEYHLSYRTGDIVSPQISSEEPLAIQLQDFVASARAGVAPAGHGELCRDVVRLIEAAEASLAEGGAPVKPREIAPAVG